MSQRIQLEIEGSTWTVELNDSASARALLEKLPLDVSMSRWGDEYYGDAGLKVSEEPDARTEMQVGELAVWPDGNAVCIFFGPTPASHGDEPRAISNVNPIGQIVGDPSALRNCGGVIQAKFSRPGEA
jgi:hypothetical protein